MVIRERWDCLCNTKDADTDDVRGAKASQNDNVPHNISAIRDSSAAALCC